MNTDAGHPTITMNYCIHRHQRSMKTSIKTLKGLLQGLRKLIWESDNTKNVIVLRYFFLLGVWILYLWCI